MSVACEAALSPVERMLIEHECARIVQHSFNLSDAARHDELVALFTEDAVVVRPSRPDAPLVGRKAIEADYAARSPNRRTFHICSNMVVEVHGHDRAEAYCHVVLYVMRADGPMANGLPVADSGRIAGEFRDVLVREGNGWKVSRRTGRLILTT